MNEKEKILQMLDIIPECKMNLVIDCLQKIIVDEELDDQICERIVQNYMDDPDLEKADVIELEECKKEWGLD